MHWLKVLLPFMLFGAGEAFSWSGKRKTCVVKPSGTNTTDDGPAIIEAFEKCGKEGRVIFKPTTYYINSVLNVTWLDDVEIDVWGTLLVTNLLICVPCLQLTIDSGALTLNTGWRIRWRSATRTNPRPSFWAAIMLSLTATVSEHSTAMVTTGISGSKSRRTRQTIRDARTKLLSMAFRTLSSRG